MSSSRTAAQADALFQLNQSRSRLLGLPRELRNAIYGYALGGNNIRFSPNRPNSIAVMPPKGNFEVWIPDRWANTLFGPLPITDLLLLQTTSRQLHAEIGNLIFVVNTLDVSGLDGYNMLRALPYAAYAAITSIRLLIPLGSNFPIGFNLQHPQHFSILEALTALQKIEVVYDMNGLGESTEGLDLMENAIEMNTNLTVAIVPCHYNYRRADDPLEAAALHGAPKAKKKGKKKTSVQP